MLSISPIVRRFLLLLATVTVVAGMGGWLSPVPVYATGRQGTGQIQPDTIAMLVGLDGIIPVRSVPDTLTIRFTVPSGSIVKVLEGLRGEEQLWYRVRLLSGTGQGWVPESLLITVPKGTPVIGSVLFCEGTIALPGDRCSAILSATATSYWVRWDFAGLSYEDETQVVLSVNEERYALRPVPRQRLLAGQQWLNLARFSPRHEPGYWTLTFFVNGRTVRQSTFLVR